MIQFRNTEWIVNHAPLSSAPTDRDFDRPDLMVEREFIGLPANEATKRSAEMSRHSIVANCIVHGGITTSDATAIILLDAIIAYCVEQRNSK